VFETRFGYDDQRHVRSVGYPTASRVDYVYHPTVLLASIPGYIDAIDYGPTGRRERDRVANGVETRLSVTSGDEMLSELLTQPVAGGPKYQHLIHHRDEFGSHPYRRPLDGDGKGPQQSDLRLRSTQSTGARDRAWRGRRIRRPLSLRRTGNLTFSEESSPRHGLRHHLGDTLHPNRLVKRHASATVEYNYDASGNLTQDPALGVLTYDSRHRLVRVNRPDGTLIDSGTTTTTGVSKPS
jgi:hypothetical protein